MKGRAIILATALATQLLGGPAFAQVLPIDTIDQEAHVPSLGIDAVQPALSVTTATHVAAADESGNEFIVATAQNGLSFQVQFQACDNGSTAGCKGMILLAMWEAPGPEERADLAAAASAFMIDRPMLNAGVLENGTPYVARYVIADFGIPQGNLVSEFSNFVRNATDFHNAVLIESPS